MTSDTLEGLEYFSKLVDNEEWDILRSKGEEMKVFFQVCSQSDDVGNTLLLKTIEKGHLPTVQWLVDKSDLLVENRCHETSLHLACGSGNLELVKWLVEDKKLKNMINNVTIRKASCLHYAAVNGHVDIVEWLLKIDNNLLTLKDSSGHSCILAASRAGQLDVVKYLSENHDCDINDVNAGGNNCIHLALRSKNLDLVQWLYYEKECSMSSKNSDGNTGFHIAAVSGDWDIVQWAFSVCDNIEEPNTIGKTPKDFLEQKGLLERLSSLKHAKKAI